MLVPIAYWLFSIDVDDRQVPQLGHVEGLVDLALVDRAVAEIGQADAAILDYICA